MVEVISFDEHAFFLTLIVTIGFQLACFAVAWTCQFDKVTDLAGSSNFIIIALLTLFVGPPQISDRALMVTIVVCVVRAELGLYLLYRVIKRGKDARFDEVRHNCGAFFVFWVFQMLWSWGVMLPVTFVNSDTKVAPDLEARDWGGLGMCILGFFVQVIADFQKDRFRSDPSNASRTCDIGVWAYSRHPNFFGEIVLWWGVFTICSPQFDATPWGYVCVLSPIFTMIILLFGSGVPTSEGNNQLRFMKTPEDKQRFLAYRAQTSPLVPLPPSCYKSLPLFVKRFLLELPMYEPQEAALRLAGGD